MLEEEKIREKRGRKNRREISGIYYKIIYIACLPILLSKFQRRKIMPVNINFLSHNLFCLLDGSSQQRCSVKKGALRNFAKFTGIHLCQILFFNKVAGLRPVTLL